jgi:hypothetical protein
MTSGGFAGMAFTAVPKDAPPPPDLGVLSVRKVEKKKPPPGFADF